ncbi:chaperonin 10-like protein [Crucibulum laeve]|uniref:Chaperonin 10-like protein n=1 Tax=Crucibulum laeve TaxID=68775 RepID=A0A5C3LUC3_9AGAR|nr:chaperonin 10-like protein [Crucibulum laeve]
MIVPSIQKALLLKSKFGEFSVDERPVPRPGPEQILVKIKSAGLNPVDWKVQKYGVFVDKFPAVIGSDIAGDIVAVGPGVKQWAEGDKVFLQGIYRDGSNYAAFQQFVIGKCSLTAKIPENISYDEAAVIPVGIACSFIGLYHEHPHGLGITHPKKGGQGKYTGIPFLVLGGSTSVGQLVIQLAKFSGFSPIITTASPKHNGLLKSLGATDIIDRNIPLSSLPDEINKITDMPIKLVFDTVSIADTQKAGFRVLAPGGKIAVNQQPAIESTEDKDVIFVMGVPNLPHNVEFLKDLYNVLTEWLREGIVKPNKVDILPGGLSGIIHGLERLENGQVSAEKLVARPQETI